MLTPARRILVENCPFYYPFGNTSVRNVLKDCQFVGDNVKVLFLGSGDLRNALKTAGNRKNLENLHIHLNDLNPSVVARNILILKIISAKSFDIQNEEDTSFLWDIWYNAEWPETTRRRFEAVLKELLDNNLPDNVAISKSCSFKTLKTVWSAWSSITSKSKSESDLFMKKIQKERKNVMFNGWFRLHKIEVDTSQSPASFFPTIVEGYAYYLAAIFKEFDHSFRLKIQKEARQYFSTGSCRLKIGVDNVCVNPTMLDPSTSRWNVHYQLCPFDGYLPLTSEELDRSDDGGILIRTCQKMLKNLVADYKKRIDGIKIFFHLEDALEFCLSENTLSFDVIDCSNLADHIGLVHLINGCEKILADTRGAILLTETMTWKSVSPTGLEYVEDSLCCPLSMIPTIYGLKLTNHIELGSFIPTNNFFCNKIPPIMLCWTKAPTFQNVKLNSSPELSRCLNQLAHRCFLPQSLQNYDCLTKSTKTRARALFGEMLCFTPSTFSYVVNSMIARVGGEDSLCFRADPAEIPCVYNLSRRTLEAWKNNKTPLKLSSDLQANFSKQILAGKIKVGFQHTAVMRLVLAPPDRFMKNCMEAISRQQLSVLQDDFSDPEIHVIDNFQLEVKQTADGDIQTARISFLLLPDHGLEETHCAYVFDVVNSWLPIFLFEPVSLMQVEEYRQPYPFPPKRPQVSSVTKQSDMRVDSCIESVDNYTFQIAIECRKNISGLKVSPDQCLPCESVHGLTLSLSQPNDIEPLALNFPFPILVKEIRATLHRQNRSIDLVLKKALYEPWPYEFQAFQSKWIADNLKPWKDGSEMESRLKTHLNIQFKMNVLRSYASQLKQKTDSASKMSTLNEVRGTITSLMESNEEFVSIRRKDSTQSPDWYLRVHLPVRISPVGSPILLLSAVDHRLVENLTLQGKADLQENLNDFTRIYEAPRFKKNRDGVLTIWTFTAEEEQLLRYILRLNSTKIMPSTWQKNNLPLGENSPWLATFVSPLYDDCPMDQEFFDTVPMQEEIKTDQTSCAACKKSSQNLKRCSRCRTIFYCSVECQRGHWTQHKNVCNNSGK